MAYWETIAVGTLANLGDVTSIDLGANCLGREFRLVTSILGAGGNPESSSVRFHHSATAAPGDPAVATDQTQDSHNPYEWKGALRKNPTTGNADLLRYLKVYARVAGTVWSVSVLRDACGH